MTVSRFSWPMLGIYSSLASIHGHPRTKSRARRRTSTATEALWCKRLPRRQRRRRREGRGFERALASTRHSRSLRRQTRSSSATAARAQPTAPTRRGSAGAPAPFIAPTPRGDPIAQTTAVRRHDVLGELVHEYEIAAAA